jgi:hypothetical protein
MRGINWKAKSKKSRVQVSQEHALEVAHPASEAALVEQLQQTH